MCRIVLNFFHIDMLNNSFKRFQGPRFHRRSILFRSTMLHIIIVKKFKFYIKFYEIFVTPKFSSIGKLLKVCEIH